MSTAPAPAQSGSNKLIVGLILGLVIGLFAGIIIGPLLDSQTSPIGGGSPSGGRAVAPRHEPRPGETPGAATAPSQPEQPKPADQKPEEPKPQSPPAQGQPAQTPPATSHN